MWQSLVAMLGRPQATEYPEFYKNYIALVPDSSILGFLAQQTGSYRQLLAGVSEEAASTRPQPGKWSLKQIVGHLCDVERVLAYRALRFARGDKTELEGFEQDDYVEEAGSNSRRVEDLMTEFEGIRKATIALFGSLPPEAELRAGMANHKRVTVRALAYVVAGHAQHHYDLLKARP